MKWFSCSDKVINLEKVLFIELGMVQHDSNGWVPGIKFHFGRGEFAAIPRDDRDIPNIASCFDSLKGKLTNDTMGNTPKND